MSIRIVNLKYYTPEDDELLIKIDRSSTLGNPFYMSNEGSRDEVCDKYQIYFDKIIKEGQNSHFINELRRIYRLSKTKNIALGCWCYPKRCHAQTIISFFNTFNK
jgi:hypothetical protein